MPPPTSANIRYLGYGYHGDFITGWDEDFLQKACDTCTNESGRIEDCPIFTVKDKEDRTTCEIPEKNIPLAAAKDQLLSKLSSLPGDVQIFSGPERAPSHDLPGLEKPSPSSEVSASVPTLGYSAATAEPSGLKAGGLFAETPESSSESSSSDAPSSSAAAVTSAPSAPAPTPTQSFFSTQYATKGNTVEEVFWVEEEVTTTIMATQTMTVGANKERKRHLHKHRRGGALH